MQATQATEPDALLADSAEQATADELIARLQADNAPLRDALPPLQAALAGAQETIAQLRARIDELERRLGLNSANSGKPPSSDGLKRPTRKRTMSLRESSNRKPGGQPGHPGERLRQVPDPTVVVEHEPSACRHCAEPLSAEDSTGYQARQVFDLPPPPPLEVTEHRAHSCQCAQCKASTQAEFPEGV